MYSFFCISFGTHCIFLNFFILNIFLRQESDDWKGEEKIIIICGDVYIGANKIEKAKL